MERFLGVYNPAAGGGRGRKLLSAVLTRLRERGLGIDVEETSGPGDGIEIARRNYRSGRRHFIAIGGDGTGFEIVNGLFPLPSDRPEDRPTLGFLPMGTGNSFLREFSDRGLEYGIESLLAGRKRPCDVLEVEHRDGKLYFINILSFGFVADVGATRNRHFHGLGQAGYVLGVLKELAGLKSRPFPLRLDGSIERNDDVTFISINNSRFTGGKMMMAPHADTADGKADVIEVGRMGRWRLLRSFPRIFKGTHLEMPEIFAHRAETIDFGFDGEIDAMVDGEMIRLAPRRLRVLPGALEARA